MEKKVFGYPEFDVHGEKVLTAYDGPYYDMLMDIRVYRMKSGETRNFKHDSEETAVLLQKGKIALEWEGNTQTVSRKDVFTEGPWVLHASGGVDIFVQALEEGSEILVQRTHNTGRFASKLYSPDDSPWKDVCRGKFGDTANRVVNTIFDYNTAPYSNMVLGEVLNDRGNWSGYIPHHHPQPEVYYFLFDRPEGFGASFVGEDVYKSTDGSFSAIPGGVTHPQVCAPGYVMYTCWMIRHLEGRPWNARIDDERYVWLYDWKGE
ncbi:MAG: 5-deoxy-glucuronate isomerase [Defluviitaleaceae bacterium]|nr:5-deoxy-glucuronate isomerase [Defluviitaleaceae bacterium]